MAPITLAPVVELNMAPLSATWQQALVELRVECQFQVPSRCTLRFRDPGYVLLATDKVGLGTTIEVSDPSETSVVLFKGEATSVGVDQQVGEQPELVVVAHDKSHRLGRATTVTGFLKRPYSEVVTTLAGNAGLSPDTTSTPLVVDHLMQADSDLGLLTELARRVGFDWWVDGESLCFKAPASTSTVTLPLGEALRSFSVRASGHHPDKVVVGGWDRDAQKNISATASEASPEVGARSSLADLVAKPARAFGEATLTTAGLAAQSQEEARQLGQAILDRGRACAVTAQGVTSGNGKVKLGAAVEVSQAGPLSGTYPVTRVEHLYRPGSGFVTRFHAGDRRPTSLVDTLSGVRPVATPATYHPGLMVGEVTNNSPGEGEAPPGQVKVKYSNLSSTYETAWARVASVGGGDKRGLVFTPEVGDQVLVGFEEGDPRQPVVIGGLHGSKSTTPPTGVKEGQVQFRSVTSRLGHVVKLLDGASPEEQAIELRLAGDQNVVHLGKDKLSITVPSGTPVEVKAGESTLSFSNAGALSMSAPSVSIKADEKIELSAPEISVAADAKVSLQGNATASLKGAEVQIQADALLQAKGAMVQIN